GPEARARIGPADAARRRGRSRIVTACCLDAREKTLEELAQHLIDLELGQELLRSQILGRMEAEGVARVDAEGGHVVYVQGSIGRIIDQKALIEKFATLAAALRALGREPDDVIPMKQTTRRAGVRANLR